MINKTLSVNTIKHSWMQAAKKQGSESFDYSVRTVWQQHVRIATNSNDAELIEFNWFLRLILSAMTLLAFHRWWNYNTRDKIKICTEFQCCPAEGCVDQPILIVFMRCRRAFYCFQIEKFLRCKNTNQSTVQSQPLENYIVKDPSKCLYNRLRHTSFSY